MFLVPPLFDYGRPARLFQSRLTVLLPTCRFDYPKVGFSTGRRIFLHEMSKWGWLGVVLLITGLVYANSLPGAFYFDDFGLMLDNPRVSSNFSYWAFLDQYGGRPLTLWSLHLNYQLAGRNPLPFHAVNLALHLLVVGMLFLLVERWTGSARMAGVTALLFGLHPLQSQAVNYVWARSILLMAGFGMIALWLVRRHPWWTLVAFQLAIWSRAEALVLAIPLALCARTAPRDDAISSATSTRPYWSRALIALCLLNLTAVAVGIWVNSPREFGWNHSDVWRFWLQQPAVVLTYLSLMVAPSGFSIDRQWTDWEAWRILAAALLLTVSVVLLWRQRRRVPAAALLGCLLLLLPACLIPNTVLLSESRAYFAFAGFALAAAWTLEQVWRRRPELGGALAVALLAACSWRTVERNRLWNNEIGIWREAVDRSPASDRVHYNLGFALARQGKTVAAEAEFELARNLNPSDDHSYAALGYCAEVQERSADAQRFYRQALFLNASNRYAREGLMRVELGEVESLDLDLESPAMRLLR